MNLTSTSKYAIRILSFMAQQESTIISAKYLVEKLSISDKYLRSLMTKLAKKGLVHSIQGRDGGYQISKDLNKVYLIEIITAVENAEKYVGCFLGFNECSDENPCALHVKYNELKKDTHTFLVSTTLNDIVMENHIMKY